MVVYLAFTGGYDSTYLLLYLLMIKKKIVQPIYLEGSIDGIKTNPKFSRDKIELNQIRLIYKKLGRFLNTSELERLLPISAESVVLHPESIRISKFLFQRGFLRRPVTQFSYLLSLAKKYKRCLYVGNLRTDRLLQDNNYLDSKRKILKLPISIDGHYLCRKICFPMCHYGKLEILHLSERYGWNEILKNTRSCWYHSRDKLTPRCIQCRYILNYQRSFRLKNEMHRELGIRKDKKDKNKVKHVSDTD